MNWLFDLLGALVLCYVVQALVKGSVHAKWRLSWRKFHRADDARYYWSAVVSYSILGIGLLFL